MSYLLVFTNAAVLCMGCLASIITCPCFSDCQEKCVGEDALDAGEMVDFVQEKFTAILSGETDVVDDLVL